MNNLPALYLLILSCSWILALTIFHAMDKLFNTKNFFNVIGFMLVFISTLLFLFWLNLDQINDFLSYSGQPVMQIKILSWSFYMLVTCGWYYLSMKAKKRYG